VKGRRRVSLFGPHALEMDPGKRSKCKPPPKKEITTPLKLWNFEPLETMPKYEYIPFPPPRHLKFQHKYKALGALQLEGFENEN